MEDEDGEGRVADTWNSLADQQVTDSVLDSALKQTKDGTYTDRVEEEKPVIRFNSIGGKDSPGKGSVAGTKIVFKGFKKRILAQTQESQTTKNVAQDQQQPSHANVSPKNSKEKRIEGKRGKITEYAQYLGLQPASKHKCSKCQSSTNFCPTVKQTQCTCNSTMAPMQGLPGTSDSTALSLASNFKISRKVYLCAACGTYFENWNLFLHMRDIHKRHICLFCLGMFGQAERLSYHLAKKHSVPEMAFSSVEDFYSIFKGSCYLVCCTCEKVFSETDNFYNHFCSPPPKEETIATVCTLCRQTGTHASTCSLAADTKLQASQNAQLGSSPALERPVNKATAKKIIRNNRTKLIDDNTTIPNRSKFSAQLKRTNSKGGVELHPIDNELPTSAVVRDDVAKYDDVTGSPAKDTVSETIMEVSKYLGESSSEENDEDVSGNEKTSEPQLDSVSQTIMEVSRCAEEIENPKETPEKDTTMIGEATDADRTTPESEIVPKDNLSITGEETTDPVESKTINEEAEEVRNENDKAECAHESKTDSISQESSSTVNSPVNSPVNRSLFSPQHELPSADLPLKEEQTEEKETKDEEPATESQSSVSFNTVTTSDRSLVIKICANKNSQFSVTAASAAATNGDDPESHNASRESEENNNGEESASEDKLSNASEQERCSVGSDRANEPDSDSDSDKLAVVDNNAEETANPEQSEEPETGVAEKSEVEEDKPEEKNENVVDKEEPESADQGVISIDTNGDIDVVGISDDPAKETQNDVVPTEPETNDGVVLAGEDVPGIDLNVEGTLESMDIEDLLKRCIEAASPLCVYCNHARHIAVNGKQLGLHMLAEHKFQPQHPAIIIQPEQFVSRVRKSLQELENRYFNLSSYNTTDGTYNVLNVRTYECFHCRFHSSVHKELYLHNRKMHQKTILVCVMCKSTFYSYSELLCHLCPGVYSPNINVKYRCCLCPVDGLPSAFRLMVHLRKRHHACDVCLESTGNQQRLSNHVWKHKLHHLCYRCGIAYRNKPDITKHLFWKHGTESVLCKKCLQKKWPHIYHFCIPPTAFVCEECGSSFSRAVALKVHKRLHSGDQPYNCTECSERFISKKLLAKHERSHREPSPVNVTVDDTKVEGQPLINEEKSDKEKVANADGSGEASEAAKDGKENIKKVVDVYDLPPLNLSSESDTDSEDEKSEAKKVENGEKVPSEPTAASMSPAEATKSSLSPAPVPESIVEVERDEEEKKQEERIMDGIWDNFKSYAASLEMQESGKNSLEEKEIETDVSYLRSIVLADHDYCVVWSDKDKKPTDEENVPKEEADAEEKPERSPAEGNAVAENESSKKKVKSPKKKKQNGSTSSSDSSSDSDSSSCSCGTNCSCSSSSSGSSSSSSSSSDSDSSASESSPRKQNTRKERKRDKDASQEVKTEADEAEHVEVTGQVENGELGVRPAEPEPPKMLLLRESDLETDETNTDEDFYDEHPQQLANKILAEKRNQLLLLAAVAPASAESTMSLNNGITDTDSMPAPSPDPITTNPVEQPLQQKKKVKTKKRKKGERAKQRVSTPTVESIKLNIPKAYYQANSGFATSSPSLVALQTSRSSTPVLSANDTQTPGLDSRYHSTPGARKMQVGSSESENKRSSKRKRVPKRFYGDSSDEDADRPPATKWRKHEQPSFVAAPSPKRTASPRFSFAGKAVPPYRPEAQPSNSIAPVVAAAAVASASDSDEPAESSSDSSDSEITEEPAPTQLAVAAQATGGPPQERTNLYCYCQCPYDEVSEMIACDGEDCRIEWFHFECVGIMVPPKGKWYCPDCRKKHGTPLNSEDYFD